jgi:hypothetical protein
VTILIVSMLQDAHAQAVMRALASQGERNVELLDLSEFPTRLCLSMAFGRKGRQLTLTRSGSGHRCIVDLDRVTSVWWRRPQPFALARDLTDLALDSMRPGSGPRTRIDRKVVSGAPVRPPEPGALPPCYPKRIFKSIYSAFSHITY